MGTICPPIVSRRIKLVNIGILGSQDCGKTMTFILFLQYLKKTGNRVVQGNPGGLEPTTTMTLDFVRFTWKSQIHALYGSGGHKTRLTEYYRKYITRAAEKFLCVIDLTLPLEPQFAFYEELFPLPARSVVVNFNKYDTPEGKMRVKKYGAEVVEFFEQHHLPVKEKFVTVAIRGGDDKYLEYNQNCVKSILYLAEKKKEDPFKIWAL
ncbi:MAG: GTPase domain-containing protein [Promethearchaeota archaeon]